MTEETMTQFRSEGEPAFAFDKENDNSSSSSEGEETENGDTQSAEGDDNTQTGEDDKLPFHQHPRWKEREDDWTKKFNEQESRHQEDLKTIREEFSNKREHNANQDTIPSWFGGDQQQWDAYRADRDAEIQQAEERAIARITEKSTAEDKAVKEATDYMQSELNALEADKTLNPSGDKIDPNKLLKYTLDNDLVDSKGRWNYRAAFKLMNAGKTETKPVNKDRKVIADATTSEGKAETKTSDVKTSADFKKSRPW